MSSRRLVWIHGLFGHPTDFELVQAALPDVLEHHALSLPGHDSPALVEKEGSGFEEATSRALSAIHQWTSEPVWLVGYSMGARLAMHIALHPEAKVAGLVAIGGHTGLAEVEARTERLRLDGERATRLEREGLPRFLADWYTLPLFGELLDDPDFTSTLMMRAALDPRALAVTMRRLSTGWQRDLSPSLAQLSCPIHWVHGVLDARYAALYQAHPRRPNWFVHALTDAAHSVHLEAPRGVAKIISQALASKDDGV